MKKMLILETSTESCGILLALDEEPIAFHRMRGGPELSKNLAAETQRLLEDYRFQPDLVAIGTGPGSFTGVRVGAALGKGLALGWNIPFLGFCSLAAFTSAANGPFAVLLDAKRGNYYALFGTRKGEELSFGKPELIPSSDPRVGQPNTTIVTPETALDPTLLAQLVFKQFLEEGAAPFELFYLSNP